MNNNFKRIIPIFLLTLIVFLGAYTFENKPDEQKEKILIKLIVQNLRSYHFLEVDIDNDFSEKAFDIYLTRLDYNKRFLIKPDIDKLNKYKFTIDEEVKNLTTNFFDQSIEILYKRIEEAETYYKDILSKPFDYDIDEEIELDTKKKDFQPDKEHLKDEWRKALKYQTLSRLYDMLETQEKAIEENDTTVKIKTYEELEAEAREKVMQRHDDWFKRMYKNDRSDWFAVYINSIANVYDPHSSYFPPKDKENFDISISGKLEGIGAQLTERDGYITVTRIIPGSPSWKQGELQEGDKIIKVAQGDEEPVDIVDMRLDDAVKLIRGEKGSEARLTVKKIDGNVVVISIIRDVIELEDVYAKSAILQLENSDKKIGYIKLPKFYVDFKDADGRRSSTDVKKEIEKIKTEDVNGIIFDLRNNSGGSLQDAVEIAGLFIKDGPIVQVKGRYGNPHIYKDPDTTVIFEKPLIVMVNSFSASASEIFAAAIQDYKRGIVIGSPSTFGKGTVQVFADLDRFLSQEGEALKPLGSLKMTTQKFYRINGGATQLKGVIPDIKLPDAYAYIDMGEKEHDYPMQWTKISSIDYNEWIPGFDNLSEVKEHSEYRIDNDSTFLLIDENAHRLKKQRDKTTSTLNLEKFKQEQKDIKEKSKKYTNISSDTTSIIATSLKLDIPLIEADSSKIESANRLLKGLKKDIWVHEAMEILDELEQ